MGKLTDIKIVARNDYGDKMEIITTVNVTKEGLFTTTLPEESANKLLDYGVSMDRNRAGRTGYFSAKTLDGLCDQVRKLMQEAISRELVKEEAIIKYQIKTAGYCYIDADGEILPNGAWAKNGYDGGGGNWAEFTEPATATNPKTAKLTIWAGVYDRKTYRFKSGREIEELDKRRFDYRKTDERTNLNWLCDQVCVIPEGTWSSRALDVKDLPEVPATEENATFFVKILQYIYRANQLFTEFSHKENIIAFIEANRPLALPDFVDNQEED